MLTNDTDYRCHTKAVARTCLTNHLWSMSHHITVLVIISLRDPHTLHTHQHIHTRTYRGGQKQF